METRSKKIAIIIVLLITVVLLYISQKGKLKEIKYTIPVIKIVKGLETHEIRVNTQSKETSYITDDGVYVLGGVRSQTKGKMEIPEMHKIQADNNIEGKKPIGIMTWASTFGESIQYLKYQQEEGYTISMQIETPQYIEVYLEKEGYNMRRIIIQRGEIVVGDMFKQVELPSIWGYLEGYTTEQEIREIKKSQL